MNPGGAEAHNSLETDNWQSFAGDDAEVLQALSLELDAEFAVERVLLPSGVAARVEHALPRDPAPLVRFARALTGAVLLASFGCVILALILVAGGNGLAPVEALQMLIGGGAVLMALLLNFAAPRLILLDAEIMQRLTGTFVVPGAWDLVVVRGGALLMAIAGGLMMIH